MSNMPFDRDLIPAPLPTSAEVEQHLLVGETFGGQQTRLLGEAIRLAQHAATRKATLEEVSHQMLALSNGDGSVEDDWYALMTWLTTQLAGGDDVQA